MDPINGLEDLTDLIEDIEAELEEHEGMTVDELIKQSEKLDQ